MMEACRLAHITDLHWRQAIPGTSGCHNRKSRLIPSGLSDALQAIKKEGIGIVALTGDLLDVPDGELSPQMLDWVEKDYVSLKKTLDESGLKYMVVPGNHDHVEIMFKVFEKRRQLVHEGYELVGFFDFEIWGTDVFRKDEELEAFSEIVQSPGARNQIHLQHYLIYDEKESSLQPYLKGEQENRTEENDKRLVNSLKAHAYANSEEILRSNDQSSRVKLSLSGHYHPGSVLEKRKDTHYYVSPSFSENYFTYSILECHEDKVTVEHRDLEEEFNASPVVSPYILNGNWFRGGLHTHCSESSSCATVPLVPSIAKYKRLKYQFLAITDHDKITSIEQISEESPEIVFYEGFEHSVSNHMLFISEKAKPLYEIEDKREAVVEGKNDLTIVCHPEGPKKGYWTVDELKSYSVKPTGVEVYNGHYGVGGWRKAGGGWDYTRFWEESLDAGMRLFAYANDDYHDGEIDLANAWNMVLAEKKTATSILKALKEGSCYASTGLKIQSIHEYKGTIVIDLKDEAEGVFYGPNHTVLSKQKSKTFEITHENENYIRFEAEDNGRKCWTQPFFLR